MKANLILVLLVIFSINNVLSQTDVGGPYFSNEIWSPSGNPYRVVGNVQIPIDYTLTIEPGVIVEFTGEYEILVKGNIIANGTMNDSITLFCSTGISTGVNMVRLVDANLSDSQFSYVKFSDAEKAISVQGTSYDTLLFKSINIENSFVLNEAANPVLIFKYGNLFNTDVKNAYNTNNTTIIIDSSEMNFCGFNSVTSNTSCFGMYINNSQVNNSTFICGGSSLYDSRLELNNLICNSCTFSTNRGKCIINDSKIINSGFNNTNTTQLCQVFFDLNRCIMVNTSFESHLTNSNNEWSLEVNIDQCVIKRSASTIMGYETGNITNSIIIGDGIGNGINILHANFSNATIVNNVIGIICESESETFSITNSNLFQNTSYNIKNNSTLDIPGNNNFWGATDPTSIRELIYDYYDDINLGEVSFNNYQNFPNTNCPISPPINFTVTHVDGGVDLTWSPNIETDLAGYKLYYGNFDGFNYQHSVNLGNVNSYFLPDFKSADTLIAITAYDSLANNNNDMINGHESWYASVPGQITNFNSTNNYSTNCTAYPNPSNDFINIDSDHKIIKHIDIISLDGKILYSNNKVNDKHIIIDIRTLPNGIYLLKVTFDKNMDIIKLIKN